MDSALKKSETGLRRLVEHLPVPALICSLEPDHPVWLVNRRFAHDQPRDPDAAERIGDA